jgi:hypothetical protein
MAELSMMATAISQYLCLEHGRKSEEYRKPSILGKVIDLKNVLG